MNRKVCIVTGTRAEYGLLRGVIEGVHRAPTMELQLLVTGAHLSPAFGLTYREIVADGWAIDARVEMLVSADSASGVAKSMGLGLIGMADAFARLQPHMVVLLGDRYEILAAAAAALVAGIPVAHLHGGEVTEGAFDESIRHAVTKMSHLHFVAAEPYRQRVIQLGEAPEHVYLVGGLGVDAIQHMALMDRAALESSLDFRFAGTNLLVTFHPVTLDDDGSEQQMAELLAVLDTMPDTGLIFTLPNADNGSRALTRQVEDFVARHPNTKAFVSLGQRRYASCLKQVDGVVGNSSSGLIEAPALGVGTVNIGDRQKGRLRADSVIDCAPQREAIAQALQTLFDPGFRQRARRTVNPYGSGGAAKKIVQVLQEVPLQGLRRKPFHDLDFAAR